MYKKNKTNDSSSLYIQVRGFVLLIGITTFAFFNFGPFFRRERLPFFTFSMGEFATVVNRFNYDSRRKQLPAPFSKDLVLFVVYASELLEAENRIPAHMRMRGGGSNTLINPYEMFLPSASKARVEREFPKPLHASGGSKISTRVPRRNSLNRSISVDHSSNQSGLLLKRNTSPFSVSDLQDYVLEGRSDSIVARALKAAPQTRDSRGFKTKHLQSMQEITSESVILNKTEKMELLEEMAANLIPLSGKRDKLKEASTRVWTTSADKDELEKLQEEITEVEEEIRLEKEQIEYYSKNALHPDYIAVATPREPIDETHGYTAVSATVYNPNFLLEEDKECVHNDLTSYIAEEIAQLKKQKLQKNTRRNKNELSQFSQIVAKAFYSGCDVNKARTKFAKPVENEGEKEITYDKKRAECKDPRYKDNDIKSRFNLVDACFLAKVELKIIDW